MFEVVILQSNCGMYMYTVIQITDVIFWVTVLCGLLDSPVKDFQ